MPPFSKRSCLPLLSLLSLATSQFVPPPTDLRSTKGYGDIPVRYKQVPDGICEMTPGVKSYSGYVDVEENEHIFWWFFEARNSDPTTAPLTVWINGGPGSSSMIGLFQELGPCGVDYNGELYYNPYAWNNVSNLIFIDQPTTTGFSYSEAVPAYTSNLGDIVQLPGVVCPAYAESCGTYSVQDVTLTTNSTAGSAPHMWKTLQGFMGAFPQYSRNGFHFATESYGGHYGPIYNEYFETQNALIQSGQLKNAHQIQLESVLIGNGWFDPLIQYAAYYNFSVYPGNTYDLSPYTQNIQDKMYQSMYGTGNCHDMTVQCAETGLNEVCSAADNFCYQEVEYVLDFYAGRDEYDIRELSSVFPYSFYEDYLNTPEVQKAIGAYTNFSSYSPVVGSAFGSTGDDDRTDGTIAAVRKLIEKGIYVVLWTGDADYNCNWLGTQAVSTLINAPGMTSAGYTNISTSDHIVNGQVKQSSNYAYARIYYSGHEIPFYQPLLSLELFTRVINRQDIATGQMQVAKGDGFLTVGTEESTFREGNGTVVYHKIGGHSIYNVTSHRPNPPPSSRHERGLGRRRRDIGGSKKGRRSRGVGSLGL